MHCRTVLTNHDLTGPSPPSIPADIRFKESLLTSSSKETNRILRTKDGKASDKAKATEPPQQVPKSSPKIGKKTEQSRKPPRTTKTSQYDADKDNNEDGDADQEPERVNGD